MLHQNFSRFSFETLFKKSKGYIEDEHYKGAPVDIWSLGILLYFLVTGTLPFKSITFSSLKQSILEGVFIIPNFISHNCQNLLRNILKRNPSRRYTIQQIASSYWLAGVDMAEEEKMYRPYPRLENIANISS